MAEIAKLREAVIARVTQGPGKAAAELRRAAFAHQDGNAALRPLLDKVVRHAYKVTDEDIAAAKAAGASEDEIFELVVCAAIGQATRQYDTALQALAEATGGHGRVGHAARDPQ